MKRLDTHSPFRDREISDLLVRRIREIAPPDPLKLCHICGTHEWTITHSGLRSLLPESVSLIAGPGCPVCIVPAREIDEAVWLALNGATIVTFGDMYRAPGSELSLEDARSRGGDVRVVYSVRDAVEIARSEPGRDFVFFAIGFETTVPAVAMATLQADRLGLANFSVLVSHVLVPPAIRAVLDSPGNVVQGFLAAGPVCTVMGTRE